MYSPELAATLTQQDDQLTHLIGVMTYSSGLERGVVTPSRISTIAMHAGQIIADDMTIHDAQPRLVIAGEQSWSTSRVTTGTALLAHPVARLTDHPITVLRNNGNRLIHTQQQTDALADYASIYGADHDLGSMTVVSFKFHAPRVREALDRSGLYRANIITVDETIQREYDETPGFDALFKELHDLDVDWDILEEHALEEFERREQVTRLFSGVFQGKLISLVSAVLSNGRYDNITRDGRAIRSRTD